MVSIATSTLGGALGRLPKTASARAAATGTLVGGACRLVGLWFIAGATAGTIELKDGGASGTSKLIIDTPASAGFGGFVPIPDGIEFLTDLHATLTQAAGVTAIYQ
jgi:hypothetical protein